MTQQSICARPGGRSVLESDEGVHCLWDHLVIGVMGVKSLFCREFVHVLLDDILKSLVETVNANGIFGFVWIELQD